MAYIKDFEAALSVASDKVMLTANIKSQVPLASSNDKFKIAYQSPNGLNEFTI
jgi:hypothetical protein